ncbi:hypothetical protein [Clostridium estertheticum]
MSEAVANTTAVVAKKSYYQDFIEKELQLVYSQDFHMDYFQHFWHLL